RVALHGSTLASRVAAINLPPPPPVFPAARTASPIDTASLSTRSVTANDPIIANRALNIYHNHHCVWVGQILQRNRASFSSSAEAVTAGYKPCHVCLP